MIKCWAYLYCKNIDTCNPIVCPVHVIYESLYSQSNIPKRYQYPINFKVDTENDKKVFMRIAEIQRNIKSWVSEGHMLVLMSPTKGNGKTSLACKLAHDYMRSILDETILDACVCFLNVPDFLESLRPGRSDSEQVEAFIKKIKKVPLLIMDDLGAEKPSDWVRERLYAIVNDRYSEMLSTIFTTNCTEQELRINLQDRIVSRVMCDEVLVLDGKEKRGVY